MNNNMNNDISNKINGIDYIYLIDENNYYNLKNSINNNLNIKNNTLKYIKACKYLNIIKGKYFMICKNNILFNNIFFFTQNLKDIINNAPKDFNILLINTTYKNELENIYTLYNNDIGDPLCFIISKKCIKNILKMYNNNFILSIYDFFNSVKTYVYKFNFISNYDNTFYLCNIIKNRPIINKDNKSINSFDIFDTLIARKVVYPEKIFELIEIMYPYKNFKNIRMESEKMANGTFDDIYINFQKITKCNNEELNKIKNYEIKVELDNLIPINSNIILINDGDILVSDMYLSKEVIETFLLKCGITKKINLYVSSDGKISGRIWNELKLKYNIKCHIGDNIVSDIRMAQKSHIFSIQTNLTNLTKFEKEIYKIDKKLCNIFREFRLLNDNIEDSILYNIYDFQIKFNIPLLCNSCFTLNNILIKENRDTVLFTTRDSCLIIKLFKFLFPQYKTITYHSSRNATLNYDTEFIEYIKNIYNKDTCIIFDLNGTFKSSKKFFMDVFGFLPRVHYLIYGNIEGVIKYDLLTYDFFGGIGSKIMILGFALEQLSPAKYGTLIRVKNNKYIRVPLEYNRTNINYSHSVINIFIDYLNKNNYKSYLNNIKNINKEIFIEYYKNNLNDLEFYNINKYILGKSAYIQDIKELNSIKLKHLKELYDIYGIDKNLNGYTQYYEELFSKFDKTINLLEIDLTKNDKMFSLNLYKKYFSNYINLFGFDKNKIFLNYNNNNIKIIIGNKTNKNSIKKLYNNTYDVIIDNGNTNKNNQQITLKYLWEKINDNGCYVMENVKSDSNTYELFINWQKSKFIYSKCITKKNINLFKSTINKIEIYQSINNKNENIIFIHKKSLDKINDHSIYDHIIYD